MLVLVLVLVVLRALDVSAMLVLAVFRALDVSAMLVLVVKVGVGVVVVGSRLVVGFGVVV